jgi:hypothetical protein
LLKENQIKFKNRGMGTYKEDIFSILGLFSKVFALFNPNPIFHSKIFISKLMISVFLFVGISITLLLESLSNSVLICEWKRKEKN